MLDDGVCQAPIPTLVAIAPVLLAVIAPAITIALKKTTSVTPSTAFRQSLLHPSPFTSSSIHLRW